MRDEQNENLRLYCFNNTYLQNIQAGIQSLHTSVELFVKYELESCIPEHAGGTTGNEIPDTLDSILEAMVGYFHKESIK